ncbi:hypothetical protein ACFFP0_15395 [Rhizobium puerariae]|uniref:Uncharacterized protein n=1 Tax=Rhizobium puerariae TaxID=1585791 RepID=A0ABV6AJL3_9HYPH
MITRHRLAKPSLHAPDDRSVEVRRRCGSYAILAMMTVVLAIAFAVEVLKG